MGPAMCSLSVTGGEGIRDRLAACELLAQLPTRADDPEVARIAPGPWCSAMDIIAVVDDGARAKASTAAVGGETAGSRCRPTSCCPSPLPLPFTGAAANAAEYLPNAWVAPPACCWPLALHCGWPSALLCGASAQIASAFGIEFGTC